MISLQASGISTARTAPSRRVPGCLIGLDIGGSKTHGVRFAGDKAIQSAVAGSANLQNVSPSIAAENLAELFSKLGVGPVDEIYVGAGGIDTDDDAHALATLIRPFAKEARITVVHDARLLLAAAGIGVGVAVIAGTGSGAWGRNERGHEARSGGWGHLLGDEGSGYWLGREAVRHSLTRMNQGHPPDQLTRRLLEACKIDDPTRLIAMFHSPLTTRSFWAGHARLVVDTASDGHQPSVQLLEQAGTTLAHTAVQTLTRLGMQGPVVLGGGLGMNVGRIQTSFRSELAEHGVTDVHVLTQDPVFGSLYLASIVTR